jgi:AcrR family transcriptional regulator
MQTKADLRPQILETATRFFIECGYNGVSMREIAEALGVSKPALYYHFKDKEELFLAILATSLDEMVAGLDLAPGGSAPTRERIGVLVQDLLSLPLERRAVVRLASQELAHVNEASRQAFNREYYAKFIGPIQGLLAEGMDRGELRRTDPAAAGWILLGMLHPYFFPSGMRDLPLPAESARAIVDVFLDGLAAR